MLSFNKGVLELTRVNSRARVSRSHLALGWSNALWIVFGSSRLGEEVPTRRLRFVFSLVVFRSCVKIDSVDMLKFTRTHKFNKFGFWFNRFWISNKYIYDFYE